MPKRIPDVDRWRAEGRKLVSQLNDRRRELQAEIGRIEEQLSRLPEAVTAIRTPASPRRGRTSRGEATPAGRTLSATIAQVLGHAKQPLSVKQIEEAVKAAGYQTTAKSLYNRIHDTLKKTGARKVRPCRYAMKT